MSNILKKSTKSKKIVNRYRQYLSVVFVSYILFPTTAFAYVDPGSGSVIVTTILGLIAAVGYTFRKYFYKIKRYITRSKPQDSKSSEDEG